MPLSARAKYPDLAEVIRRAKNDKIESLIARWLLSTAKRAACKANQKIVKASLALINFLLLLLGSLLQHSADPALLRRAKGESVEQ